MTRALIVVALAPSFCLGQVLVTPSVSRRLAAVQRQAAALAKSIATKQSDGHTIYAKVGGRLEVYLPAQMGTGYGWHVVANDPKILEQQGAPTLGELDPDRGMGREQMEVFVFAVKAAGAASLKLEYNRPWDRGVPPADKFSVTIVAK